AGPEPVSALTQAPPAPATATATARATAPPPATTTPTSAVTTVAAPPTRRSRQPADADHVFVVPTGAPARTPATSETPPRRCAQWPTTASDEHAAALLIAARQNEGGAEVPSPGVVRAYRVAITAACAGPGRSDDN